MGRLGDSSHRGQVCLLYVPDRIEYKLGMMVYRCLHPRAILDYAARYKFHICMNVCMYVWLGASVPRWSPHPSLWCWPESSHCYPLLTSHVWLSGFVITLTQWRQVFLGGGDIVPAGWGDICSINCEQSAGSKLPLYRTQLFTTDHSNKVFKLVSWLQRLLELFLNNMLLLEQQCIVAPSSRMSWV